MIQGNACLFDGCDAAPAHRGYCRSHYRRLRRSGALKVITAEDRFWSRVDKTDDCWNWTGSTLDDGYALFSVGGKNRLVHRYAYELQVGVIPDGMDIDHTCHNRRCVRPAHLRLATPKQNRENHRGAQRNSKSGVLGVHWVAKRQRWRATVGHNYKIITVGEFRQLADAAEAVRLKRLELHTYNDADRGVSPCR